MSKSTAPKLEAARGNCYQAAFVLLDFYRHYDARLVHGIVTQTAEPFARMGHAWIEIEIDGRAFVIDGLYPTSPIDRAHYYEIGKIDAADLRRYTPVMARSAYTLHRRFGPWSKKIGAAAHA